MKDVVSCVYDVLPPLEPHSVPCLTQSLLASHVKISTKNNKPLYLAEVIVFRGEFITPPGVEETSKYPKTRKK